MIKYLMIIILASCIFCTTCFSETNQEQIIQKNKRQTVFLIIAHQDDEIVISHTIHNHVKKGDKVFIIWTSEDTDLKIKEVRKSESIEAMKYLGISKDNLVFLNYPQCSLYKNIAGIINSYLNLIFIHSPTIIYTSAFEGGHMDHDTVNFCVYQAVQQSRLDIIMFEFPLYNGFNNDNIVKRIPSFNKFISNNQPEIVSVLTREQVKFKKEVWGFYKTQHSLFNFLIWVSGDSKEFWSKEKIRLLISHNYHIPPHKGKLNYEYNFPVKFKDFENAVLDYEKSQTK